MICRKMDGWCVGFSRFKKSYHQRGLNPAEIAALDDDELQCFPFQSMAPGQQTTRTTHTSCKITSLPSTLPCSSHS